MKSSVAKILKIPCYMLGYKMSSANQIRHAILVKLQRGMIFRVMAGREARHGTKIILPY